MSKEHVFEQVADELAEWIEETSDFLVEALSEGGRAPFAADASEAEKADYWHKLLFLPDGSPNVAARQQLLATRGAAVLAEALQGLGRREAREAREVGQ